MTVNNKRVFYVKYLAHEIYTEILKARPDVRLDRLENESPDAETAPILSAAHAYQIGAARDRPQECVLTRSATFPAHARRRNWRCRRID